MNIDYRIRNIVIAGALAAAAVVLTVIYVNSSREHQATQAESVTIYATSGSYPAGTSGATIAGNLRKVTVSRAAAVPDAITSPNQIRNLYTIDAVYAGEQLTLRRFAPAEQKGVLAKLHGKQRAMQLAGDATQLLSGIVVAGNRVDIVANLKSPDGQNAKTIVALRGLLVLGTDKDKKGAKVSSDTTGTGSHAVVLAVTQDQAQRLYYVMKNGDWALALRPVKKPRDEQPSSATYQSVVSSGL